MHYLAQLQNKYGTAVFFALILLIINTYNRFHDTDFIFGVFSQLTTEEISKVLIGAIGLELITSPLLFLFTLYCMYVFLTIKDTGKRVFLYFLLTYGVLDWLVVALYDEMFFSGIGSLLLAVIMFVIFNQTLKGNNEFEGFSLKL